MTESSKPVLRSRRLTSLILIVLALALLFGGYWFFTQGPGRQLLSPAGSAVAAFGGEGSQTTEPFQVREGWAIEWESTGDTFAFAIQGDRDFGTVIDIDEPGNGVTSPTGGGSYHLEVTAQGAWSITIKQGN